MELKDLAKNFVNKYPAMFTEDKEWWEEIIKKEIINGVIKEIVELKDSAGIKMNNYSTYSKEAKEWQDKFYTYKSLVTYLENETGKLN